STAHSHHDAAASVAPTDAPVLHRARMQESAVKPPADHGHLSHAGMEHGAMNHSSMKDAPVQQVQMDHTTMDHTQMH
ncbi:copper resistance protein CopB, partial [Xanthomonas vesicatoria]